MEVYCEGDLCQDRQFEWETWFFESALIFSFWLHRIAFTLADEHFRDCVIDESAVPLSFLYSSLGYSFHIETLQSEFFNLLGVAVRFCSFMSSLLSG